VTTRIGFAAETDQKRGLCDRPAQLPCVRHPNVASVFHQTEQVLHRLLDLLETIMLGSDPHMFVMGSERAF
jgi:hypothetical protein